jgi:hypothetical protein
MKKVLSARNLPSTVGVVRGGGILVLAVLAAGCGSRSDGTASRVNEPLVQGDIGLSSPPAGPTWGRRIEGASGQVDFNDGATGAFVGAVKLVALEPAATYLQALL